MKKELGQFFTPLEIVDEMINLVGDITGKKICDNSCGNGNFLIKIVEKLRIIHIDDSSFLESLNNVYIKFGATASTTSYTFILSPTNYYEMVIPQYTGQIDAIAATSSTVINVTEY